MPRLVGQLLNLRRDEWPRFLLLYAMSFIGIVGLTWGEAMLEAAFLKEVGVGALAWFFVARALLSIPAVAVYTAFADRIANDRLLIGILGVTGAGVVLGVGLLAAGWTALAVPFLYLLLFLPAGEILAVHWYTYVNGFYDTRAAKRVVPVLGTAGVLAGVVAGFTMPLLSQALPLPGILLIWLGAFAVMGLLARVMPALLGEAHDPRRGARPSADGAVEVGVPAAHLENIREGCRFVAQSPFLRWLAAATVLLIVLLTLLQYQTSQVLLGQLRTTEEIAGFLGLVTGVASIIVLPLQLVLLGRLIGRVGLGNANLIYPVGLLGIVGGLVAAPGLLTAALAQVGRNSFYAAVGYLIDSLLYNAVPVQVKGRARAVIGGLLTPVAMLAGGGLLLLPAARTPWVVPALLVGLGLAHALSAVAIRGQYGRALVAMLDRDDYGALLARSAAGVLVADRAMLDTLRRRLEESVSGEPRIFLATLIGQLGGNEGVTILADLVRREVDPRVRSAVLGILTAHGARGEEARRLYTAGLADPDPLVRQAALDGLEGLGGARDARFLALAAGQAGDPDLAVQTRVLPALLGAPAGPYRATAERTLAALLADAAPARRAAGVGLIGLAHDRRFQPSLIAALADPADEVRRAAVVALGELAGGRGRREALDAARAPLRRLAADPAERVRESALRVLATTGDEAAPGALALALGDASPVIRATAAEALVEMGRPAIEVVRPLLQAAGRQRRTMAVIVLSRISPERFGGLVEARIVEHLHAAYRHLAHIAGTDGHATVSGIGLLHCLLRERTQELLAEVFALLGATRDREAVRVIAAALRGPDPFTRADAAEALEALTNPRIAHLMLPLVDPALPPAAALAGGAEHGAFRPVAARTALEEVLGDPSDTWAWSVVIHALGQIGATLAPAAEPVAAVVTPRSAGDRASEGGGRRVRAGRVLDLLSTLVDAPDTPIESAPPPPPPPPAAARPATPDPTPALLTRPDIEALLQAGQRHPEREVGEAARAALRRLADQTTIDRTVREDHEMLSTVERIIFLKSVPFFESMTVEQLRVLAAVCEEDSFPAQARIFNQGDPGGALYVVVSGRVGIEQEKRPGSFARLATVESHSYFGEMNLFDGSPHSAAAIAVEDTLALRIRREPLIALARQQPDLLLELVNVLSARLRAATDRIADLSRTRPRELHKLFDQL